MSAAEHPSAQRGEAFGLFIGTQAVGEIITHEPPVAEMAHLVAEDGIGVAEEHRGRGHGKALLAAWTREMQVRGRVCVHSTSISNVASVALAKAVGYLEYARARGVTWGEPEWAGCLPNSRDRAVHPVIATVARLLSHARGNPGR